MVADYLDESFSLNKSSTLAVVSLNIEAGIKKYFLEILNTVDFKPKFEANYVADSWTSSRSETDRVFARLLPFSEYIVLAKFGERQVIVHHYGLSGLKNRTIETDFSQIVDLKVGKIEKLIYIVDKGHGLLAEYFAEESGCPKSDLVEGCSRYFLNQDV
jgi:hypothetical protein